MLARTTRRRVVSVGRADLAGLFLISLERCPADRGIEHGRTHAIHRVGRPEQSKRVLTASLHDHDFGRRFTPMRQSFTHPRCEVISLMRIENLVMNPHRMDHLTR
jgi:hypothetical protein